MDTSGNVFDLLTPQPVGRDRTFDNVPAHEIVFSSTSWSHRAQEMRSQTFLLLTPQPVGRHRTFDDD